MKRTVVFILILGVIGFLVYSWHKKGLETARQQEKDAWFEKTGELEGTISDLSKELKQLRAAVIPNEKLKQVFGQEATGVYPKEGEISPEKIELQVEAFFSYLDRQEYLFNFDLKAGSYQKFLGLVRKLSLNPPLVTGETESLHRFFLNLAHFYRILGKKRIDIVKEVLKNETEIIEPLMATFYLWFIQGDETGQKIKSRPSLKVLYEYSGYFMNTMSGRAYLLRREPKVRIITTYYCVLVLDRANDKQLNSFGIDIRPHIKSLSDEIRNHIGLMYYEQYLSELKSLEEKYF